MWVAHQVTLVFRFFFWCLGGPQCWTSWACYAPPHHTSGAAPAHCGSANPVMLSVELTLTVPSAVLQQYTYQCLGSYLGSTLAVPWQNRGSTLAGPWQAPWQYPVPQHGRKTAEGGKHVFTAAANYISTFFCHFAPTLGRCLGTSLS